MRDFDGKVAVVTGAASGMGRALAERFAREGMHVVLADVEREPLQAAVRELTAQEFDVLGVLTDVSSQEGVDELAERTLDAYGGVHVLCNNAGVGTREAHVWEYTLNDWRWTFGVNLWGVVHGIRTFLPIMLQQDEDGHVVNTASVAGLGRISGPIYGATKHAVVRLTEGLYEDLAEIDSKINVTLLCPGGVRTRFASSLRNRPESMWGDEPRPSEADLALREQDMAQRARVTRLDPPEVAEQVLQAIQDEQFYLLTDHEFDETIRVRTEDILARRNPGPRPF